MHGRLALKDIIDSLVHRCLIIILFQAGWTPLMIAASAGRHQIMSILITCGAQVNAVNQTGQCALHYAASKNRYEVSFEP